MNRQGATKATGGFVDIRFPATMAGWMQMLP